MKNWQVNGIASWLSGHAVHDRRRQRPAAAAGRPADDQRHGRAAGRLWRGRTERAVVRPGRVQPAGQRVGQQRPQRVPRAGNWNLDLSLFRAIPIGTRRLEFRVESQNVFNHTQWGEPGDRLHRSRTSCASADYAQRRRRGRCSSACGSRSRCTRGQRSGPASAGPAFFFAVGFLSPFSVRLRSRLADRSGRAATHHSDPRPTSSGH